MIYIHQKIMMGLILNGIQLNGAVDNSPNVGNVRLCDPHLSLRMQKIGALLGAGWTAQQIFQHIQALLFL